MSSKCRSIAYSCTRGHSWVVSLSKATKSWCTHCWKEDRETKRINL